MKIAAAAAGLLLVAGLAGPSHAAQPDPCASEAAAAERAAGIPEGLLLAIGKRESGRFDPARGQTLPWPWSINHNGASHVFETRDAAIAYVAAALGGPTPSIDVGCFQINLKYHPHAFASLADAFDPAANAAYAARFLAALHDREGSWERAVADYHSATPVYGEPYRDAVLALWRGFDAPLAKVPGDWTARIAGIRVWGPPAALSPVSSAAVTVLRGGSSSAVRPAVVEFVKMVRPHRVHGLPQVITPLTPVAAL